MTYWLLFPPFQLAPLFERLEQAKYFWELYLLWIQVHAWIHIMSMIIFIMEACQFQSTLPFWQDTTSHKDFCGGSLHGGEHSCWRGGGASGRRGGQRGPSRSMRRADDCASKANREEVHSEAGEEWSGMQVPTQHGEDQVQLRAYRRFGILIQRT